MQHSAKDYFESNLNLIRDALGSIDKRQVDALINRVVETIHNHCRIVVSGFGKNIPICEKFVGTMVSMGIDTAFLHPSTALHGDIGILKSGDFLLVLSKSADTPELIDIIKNIQHYPIRLFLITFAHEGALIDLIADKISISLAHEGDLWNVLPNNSTTISLIILQTVAIEVSKALGISFEKDFLPNHPAGAIGKICKKKHRTNR